LNKSYDFSGLSFLVVDDNAYMISIIKTLLTGFGVKKVYEATDAADGFEEFRTSLIDVIILDYAMETLDGIEFTRLVRTANDSPNRHVPIIMLSAHSERSRVIEARNAGVTEFMCKPICAKDLFRRIVEVVDRPRDFVRTNSFFGPDRRRHSLEAFTGTEKRDISVQLEDGEQDDAESAAG